MTAYIVLVQSHVYGTAKVSSEGYTSLVDAENFILGRGDRPHRVKNASGPVYESERNRYTIESVRIRKESI